MHHYLQLGFKPEYILNLSMIDKAFFNASMLHAEEEEKRIKRMGMG